jgi:hypothetical protein
MRLRGSLRGTLPVLALLALLAHDGMAREPGPRTLQTPQTLLWMWDRPQLFSSPPAGVGIAYLHATVRLSGDQARTSWRQWPLRIAPGVMVVPVVHVTLDNLAPSPVDEAQQQAIAAALEHAAAHSRSGWVQLDFEARRSQREAYAALLERLCARWWGRCTSAGGRTPRASASGCRPRARPRCRPAVTRRACCWANRGPCWAA